MGELTQEQKQLLALAAARARLAASSQGATEAAPAPPERGAMDVLRENLLGDNDPTTQNFGERVGSTLNKAGEAMTFGLIGDEADAAVAAAIPGGMDYDDRLAHNRGQEEILERDNPALALGAEIGGSLVGALSPVGAIGTLQRGARLLPRIGASATAGAIGGGTYGFMEGEGLENRADQAQLGAVIGGSLGAAIPAVGATVQRGADAMTGRSAVRRATQNAPSSQELRALGRAAYQQVDDAGVQISAPSFENQRQRIIDELMGETGYTTRPGGRTITPNTSAVMDNMAAMSDEMAASPTAALPFRELDSLRRQSGSAAGNVANPTDQKAGMTIIEQLDDYVRGLSPDDIAAGDAGALQTALPRAREIWGRMSRSQLIDDAMDQSENYLSGGSSAIRNQFAKILRNPRLVQGFSDAEKAAMRRVVQGTVPEQLLNLLGGGLGQIAQMGVGAATGGLPGTLLGMTSGALARRGSESMTRRNAEVARALVAGGQMRGGMPVASDRLRQITEGLMRQTAAVGPQ